jgi:hypothetical protein
MLVNKAKKSTATGDKARFVFWGRHSNDIDHMAPIIYGLLENGISPSDIRYIALSPKKHIIPDRDNRLIFLANLGVPMEMPHAQKWHMDKLYRAAKSNPKSKAGMLFSRAARSFYYRGFVGKDYFKWPNWRYALGVIEETPPGSVFVFDHKDGIMYRSLVKAAQKKGITCVSVPHGLIVFYEQPGGEHIEEVSGVRPEERFLGFYDWVVMPNEFSLRIHQKMGLLPEKMIVLGSARFCPEWMGVMEKIYPEPSILMKRPNHLNVLFILEKGTNKVGSVSFVDQQMKTIEFLCKEPNVDVIVKLNPRSISEEQEELLKSIECPKFDTEYMTQELVAWSDVVVAGASSVTFDPLMRNTKVIIMDYVQPVTLVYSEYMAPYIAESYEKFVEYIQRIKENDRYFTYSGENLLNLIDDFVFAGEPENSVLNRHYKFLSSLLQ